MGEPVRPERDEKNRALGRFSRCMDIPIDPSPAPEPDGSRQRDRADRPVPRVVLAARGWALDRRPRRHVADLTAESGEVCLPLNDLSRLLGLRAADVPSRNNKLVRTLARAEQFGLAFTSLGVPGAQVTFGIHGHVALVPARLLDRLPEVARQRHLAAVAAANEALTAAGLPGLRSAVPAAWRTPERPETVAGPSTTHSAPAEPRQNLHAVPPVARLDASVAATTPPPEHSL